MVDERWQRLEGIYHAARSHSGIARDAFLDGACEGDSSLRHEIQSLLDAEGHEPYLLQHPVGTAASNDASIGSVMRAFAGASPTGAYQILEQIGAGGMGRVYRARETALDREVALKVLPDAFVRDPDRLARFAREARMLASLNHPHIASIYGLAATPSAPALVLEHVPGPTLAERIARGPIPLHQALALARDIADAVEYAHDR